MTRPVPPVASRAWSWPLWRHVAVLAALLVLAMTWMGPGSSLSADEGAAIVQAKRLSSGEGWLKPDPLHVVDPSGEAYGFDNSDEGPSGFATFAKHPLYAVALAGADWLDGIVGMTLLSVAGALAAAVLCAALAALVDVRLKRPALWFVGIASPLVFQADLVVAHALGAAFCAGATLLALRALRYGSWRPIVGSAACIAVACLLRNESLLFAIALAVGTLAGAGRAAWRRGVAVAAAVAVAAVVANRGERIWVSHILGHGAVGAVSGGDTSGNYLSDHVAGLVTTTIRPGYGESAIAEALVLVAALCLIVGALLLRSRRADPSLVRVLAIVGAALTLVPLAIAQPILVPGFAVACPIAVAGWCLLRREALRSQAMVVMLATVVLFAAAVVATQYRNGGSGEWGWRYFTLALPLVIPVALVGLDTGATRLKTLKVPVLATVVVAALSLQLIGLWSQRGHRAEDGHLRDAVLVAASQTPGPDLGDGDHRPIVVTQRVGLARLWWKYSDTDWRCLLVPDGKLSDYVDKLRAAGVDEFVFVSVDPTVELPVLESAYTITDRTTANGDTIVRLRRHA